MQDNQREELIYLSGLFDGEGCIMIQKDTRVSENDNGKGWNPIYSCGIRLGMVNKESVTRFLEVFEVGQIALEKHRANQRPIYRWQVRAKEQVIHVLKLIIPFLRLKKPQAILAMRFYEETFSRRGTFLTKDHLQKREDFFQQMKKMNAVGIAAY